MCLPDFRVGLLCDPNTLEDIKTVVDLHFDQHFLFSSFGDGSDDLSFVYFVL